MPDSTFPKGLALLGTKLYVADNYNQRVRAVDTLTRAVTTVAEMVKPECLAVSGTTLYVSSTKDHLIRTIDLASEDKTVGTLCGISGTSGSQDGDCSTATMNGPRGMAIAGSVLYVADLNNDKIRAIDLVTKQISTFAGTGTEGHIYGPTALEDQYRHPRDVAVWGGLPDCDRPISQPPCDCTQGTLVFRCS